MNLTKSIIGLLLLIACNDKTKSTNSNLPITNSLYIDTSNISGSGGQKYEEFTICNFDEFLNYKNTPQLAKLIYLDKDWNLNRDNEALALLDSLNSKTHTSRVFYFRVVTNTYKKADGYFSEALGLAGKEFVEKNTSEFASFFNNQECFSRKDLETWADIVLLDFQIEQDNVETTKDEHLIYGYCRKLKKQSLTFSKIQQETIADFTIILEKKWGDFLKNI